MNNTLITQDRLEAISTLSKLAPTEGDIAEVGIYKGGSFKLLCELFPDRSILGFDTFEGLPLDKWNPREVHKPGEFSDTSLEGVTNFLSPDGKPSNWTLTVGIFPGSAYSFVWKTFAFVHIDTDFYECVKDSIDWFWPRLVDDGIMVFDDYDWPNCPGVKKALDEFGEPIKQLTKYQAYITKTNKQKNESTLLT